MSEDTKTETHAYITVPEPLRRPGLSPHASVAAGEERGLPVCAKISHRLICLIRSIDQTPSKKSSSNSVKLREQGKAPGSKAPVQVSSRSSPAIAPNATCVTHSPSLHYSGEAIVDRVKHLQASALTKGACEAAKGRDCTARRERPRQRHDLRRRSSSTSLRPGGFGRAGFPSSKSSKSFFGWRCSFWSSRAERVLFCYPSLID